MILDHWDNVQRYPSLATRFARAFAFIGTLDRARPDGRCDIDGDNVYATIMSYETKLASGPTHEAHRVYADVHFLLTGSETVFFTPVDRLGPGNGYHAEKDYELFDAPARPGILNLQAGQFAIFFPGEGHKAGIQIDRPEALRKVVVKVRV